MSRISPSGSLANRIVHTRDRVALVSSGGASVRQVAPVFAPSSVSQHRASRPDIVDASFVDIGSSSDATFIGRFSVAEVYARVAAPSPLTKGRTTDFFV
jgi:hypothetical protein